MIDDQMRCSRCSAPLTATDQTCPFCGLVIADRAAARPEPPPPPPSGPPAAKAITEAASVASTVPPWENWREFGFFRALWLTWKDSAFRPVQFFQGLPPRGGYGSPLGYAVLATIVGLFFSFYWGVVEEALSGTLEQGLAMQVFGGLVTLGVGVPLYVGLLFTSVAVIHIGFMVVGAGRQGFEATFRAVAYACGPAVFAIVPFFGPLLSLVWGMVLVFVAVREVQRTTNVRASLGFLVPFLAFLVFVVVVRVLFGLLLGSMELGQPV
jgi:hypothetical protein